MAQIEDEIIAEGVQIIWVLEANRSGQPGTAEDCRTFMAARGSSRGICVGDSQTMPTPGVWDRSPFAIGRGFDLLMRRDEMRIDWVSTHGTPSGNENPTQDEILQQVREYVASGG